MTRDAGCAAAGRDGVCKGKGWCILWAAPSAPAAVPRPFSASFTSRGSPGVYLVNVFFVRTSENTVTRGGRGRRRALPELSQGGAYLRPRTRARTAPAAARAGLYSHFRRSHEDTRHGNKAKPTDTLAAVVHWRHTAPPKATVWALVVGRSGILVAASPAQRGESDVRERS